MRPCGARSWHIDHVAPLAERLRGARRTGRVAVLRGADQRAGRSPQRCVKTGVPTDGATTVRAVAFDRADVLQVVLGTGLVRLAAKILRRPTLDVVVAVSPLAWRHWQRSLMIAVTLGSAGAALIAFGIAPVPCRPSSSGRSSSPDRGRCGCGPCVRWWIGVRYRPTRDEVVVSQVSAGFDDDARRLFTRAVLS